MADVKRRYDSTVARMAGNIAAGIAQGYDVSVSSETIAKRSVEIAQYIIAILECQAVPSEPYPASAEASQVLGGVRSEY